MLPTHHLITESVMQKSNLVKQYTSCAASNISKVRMRILSQEFPLGAARYVHRSSAPVCPVPIPVFQGKGYIGIAHRKPSPISWF